MKVLSLNGVYRMCSSAGTYCCPADIPGSDIGNLMKRGLIPDVLNVPGGERIAEKAASEDYVFTRTFDIGQEFLEYENAVLCFDKLDTLCVVSINGERVLSCENAHISYRVAVKKYLKSGQNELKLSFSSPLNYIRERQRKRPLPANVNGENGAQYLRKANCAFGWDWGPSVPYNYCGNVEIRFSDREIANVSIEQHTNADRSFIKITADNVDECYLITPSGERLIGKDLSFTVEHPELWYTSELSGKVSQPLYTVVLKNDEMTVEKKIGLRSVELDMSTDDRGRDFAFLLNGKRIFVKGANVVPFAALPEYAAQADIDYYVELAAKSNFNMLRVWGGGEYASERFLERCDELGILVWQDLCFACMMYPLDEEEFLENAKAEITANVKRMTCHPCVALFCGNNEIEEMNAAIPGLGKLKKAYTAFFYETLPSLLKPLTELAYIPTSPVGKAPFNGNSDENTGDSHMWSVWHGLMPSDHYGTRYPRFLSEFGMESLPSLAAVRKFAQGENSVYSPAFTEHQKCRDGNRKMMYYLCEKYSDAVSFDLLPYLTGIMQADCVKAAAEHFRRHKGRCNGAVFWQFNDVWNAPSWSAVDFEKIPKALMYKARDFFASVTLTHDGRALYLHNDTMRDWSLRLNFELFNGGRLKRVFDLTVVSKADSVVRLGEFVLAENDVLRVKTDGKRYLFDNVKTLPKVNLSVEEKNNSLIIRSDGFARNIFIDSDMCPDDNYFSLLPDEEKRVTFAELPGNYRVLCENDIRIGGAFRKTLFRFAYRLIPRNAVTYLWHRLHERRNEG